MKLLRRNLFLMLCIIVMSCDSNIKESEILVDMMTLEVTSQTKIVLDSLTGFSSPTFQVINSSNGETNLALYNPLVNRIQVYDLQSGLTEYYVDIERDGPNSVGESPSSFYVINKDSILVFDSWSKRVSLINLSGTLLDKYDLVPNGINDGFAVPQASTQMPMLVIGNSLYMAGLLLPWSDLELNQNQFLRYNLTTKELNYIVKRPNLYNEHNWGSRVMLGLNYSYNSLKNEFIFSFNNYDSLIITDINGDNRTSYYTPSKYFDKIVPYENKFSYKWDDKKQEEYNFQNPRFWSVIHDPFNNVSYRFALRPNSREKFLAGTRNMQVSIIILNSKYERIGEVEIDRSIYDTSMCFVTEKGLHIASKKKFQDNGGEVLVFDIFNLRQID
jgi:hypothetical protein